MTSAIPPFTLRLLGTFRFLTPDGRRIEIASKKGVALIALLAMAEDGERNRGWLQDKLWSNREPAQARSSLRRELSNLRRQLNKGDTELLICEGDRVELALQHILLDTRPADDAGLAAFEAAFGARSNIIQGEFLEGLDISGAPGFDDWLRDQRQALTRSASAEKNAPGLNALAGDAAIAAKAFNERPALAVLPFLNLTGDPSNDYISEGISEDLIDRLARLRWLPVIARSSSFTLPPDALANRQEVGQGLKARYVLAGKLRQIRDVLDISTNLSDTETGYVLWSQRTSLPLEYSSDALERILANLVSILDIRIDHAEQGRAREKPQSDLNVSDLIWRGRWHLNRFTREDAEAARQSFKEALDCEPHSPEALIQATFCEAWSIWAKRQSDEQIVEMRKLAQRAIDADPEDGRGHMLAGIAEMWMKRQNQAKSLLEQAIALNPSLAMAHAQLGGFYNLAGEPEKAIGPLQTALRLSPNDHQVFYTLAELALAHCMLGDWQATIENAEQALVRRPAYWYAHVIKINGLARSGDIRAASIALDELLVIKKDFSNKFVTWLPFMDRSWADYLAEGLTIASPNPMVSVDGDGEGG
jgi:TolB-like protein